MVTREMIQNQVDLWSESPEDTRGELEDHMRSYLEENIPLEQRTVERGGVPVDQIEYILEDLGSYFVGA